VWVSKRNKIKANQIRIKSKSNQNQNQIKSNQKAIPPTDTRRVTTLTWQGATMIIDCTSHLIAYILVDKHNTFCSVQLVTDLSGSTLFFDIEIKEQIQKDNHVMIGGWRI
jgi:hypothetical protein